MQVRVRAAALVTLVTLGWVLPVGVAEAQDRPSCNGERATIVGTNGPDTVRGTDDFDVAVLKRGADVVRGKVEIVCAGPGRDRVKGGFWVDAGPGADKVFGAAGADTIFGGPGGDLLDGGPGKVYVGGHDHLIGGPGRDRLFGAVGADELEGGPGNDRLEGGGDGGDLDAAVYTNAAGPVEVDLGAGIATGEGRDTIAGIGVIEGSAFDDVLEGDALSNHLGGAGGNDELYGRGGLDQLWGDGTSAFCGRAEGGDDLLDAGAAGEEIVRGDFLAGCAGNDRFVGGPGPETLLFIEADGPMTVDLTAGTAEGEGSDTIDGVDRVIGSDFDDHLIGDSDANDFEGLDGHDLIEGAAGNDSIIGGGDLSPSDQTYVDCYEGYEQDAERVRFTDTLRGDDGDDFVVGCQGNDVVEGGAGDDIVAGERGDDRIDGGPGIDAFWITEFLFPEGQHVDLAAGTSSGDDGSDQLSGIENVQGTIGQDTLLGDDAANVLQGRAGDDTLDGRGVDDTLDGGPGTDSCSNGETTTACE